LYRSADAGDTWKNVWLETAPSSLRRLAVCHDPWRGDVAYAFGQDNNGLPAPWRRDAPGADFVRTFCPLGINLDQADYDWFAAVSPPDPNVVYLGAVSPWKDELRHDDTSSWANISSRVWGD
jgi:hypothetical protein